MYEKPICFAHFAPATPELVREQFLKAHDVNSHVANRLANLPAFHPTALRLLTVATESETALKDFENCFKSDPALASELLVVANSAEFGLRAEVESIRHALTLLGLERVSSLSFTVAMKFYMRNIPRRQVLHPVWSHSVAAGLIAETLGDAFHAPMRSLYTAGLMHDVGRLGLLMAEAGKYEVVLTQTYECLDEATALEQATFGVTHAEAGAMMAENWGIPQPVFECMRHHHGTFEGEPCLTEILDLVRIACRMATALGYPELNCKQRETLEDATENVPGSVRKHISLSPEHLGARIKKMLASVW
jgi:putative nucleotidyltransferase with HDIG domain